MYLNPEEFEKAVANLKAVMADSGNAFKKFSEAANESVALSNDMVGLSLIDGVPEWLWEILHPKGVDGKFVKKGSASYLYGHAKTAKFQKPGGTELNVTLEPGESLLHVNNSPVKINAHGQAKVLSNISGKPLGGSQDEWLNKPSGSDSWEQFWEQDKWSSVKKVDDNPAEFEFDAEDLATAEEIVKAEVGKKDTSAPALEALKNHPMVAPSAPEAEKTPVPGTPDKPSAFKPPAGQKTADFAVATTKAGPPFGPNVWITPDYKDENGKPFLMSGQGEKSTYSVFASDAEPMKVYNSKGEVVDGLDPAKILHTDINKKGAKAWLVAHVAGLGTSNVPDEEDFYVQDPDVGEPLQDWELELLNGYNEAPEHTPAPPVEALDGSTIPSKVLELLEVDPAKDQVWGWQPAGVEKVGSWMAFPASVDPLKDPSKAKIVHDYGTNYSPVYDTNLGNIQSFFKQDSDWHKALEPSKADTSEVPDATVPAEEKPLTLSDMPDSIYDALDPKDDDELYVYPQHSNMNIWVKKKQNSDAMTAYMLLPSGAMSAEISLDAQHVATFPHDWTQVKTVEQKTDGKGPAPEAPVKTDADVKFTKIEKTGSGLIKWNVLGASDAFGGSYEVWSQAGTFDIFSSSGELLHSEKSAKGAKAWIAAQSNSAEQDVEELPVDESLPEWAQGMKPLPLTGTSSGVIPMAQYGNEAAAEHIIVADLGFNVTYGIAPDGTVVSSSKDNTSFLGQNIYAAPGEESTGYQNFSNFLATATHYYYGKNALFDPDSDTAPDITPEDPPVSMLPTDAPAWAYENELTYGGPAGDFGTGAFPYGTKYLAKGNSGSVYGVDSEGYVTHGTNKGLKAGLLTLTEYLGEPQPSNVQSYPFKSAVVANTDLPDAPEADNLPSGDEEPSKANPTPGDPKAHLNVPVVGYKMSNGETVPGTYTTKTLKGPDGKPYFITANGKPNNWEVYTDTDAPGLYDLTTGTWGGDEASTGGKPLKVFKQLKDAKAWLWNNSSEKTPEIESQGDTDVLTIGGAKYYLGVNDIVWHKKDYKGDDVYTVVVPHTGQAYSISAENVTTHEANHFTPIKAKKGGWTLFKGDPKKGSDFDYDSAAAQFDYAQDGETLLSNSKSNVAYYQNEQRFYRYYGDGVYSQTWNKMEQAEDNSGYSLGNGNWHDTSTMEDVQKVAQAFVDTLEKSGANYPHVLAYAMEQHKAASGAQKSKWTKVIARIKDDIAVADGMYAIARGEMDEDTFARLGEAESAVNNYQQDYGTGWAGTYTRNWAARAAKTMIARKRAAEWGFDPESVKDIHSSNKARIELSTEDFEEQKNKLAESYPEISLASSETVGRVLFFQMMGQHNYVQSLLTAAKKQYKTKQAVQQYLDWKNNEGTTGTTKVEVAKPSGPTLPEDLSSAFETPSNANNPNDKTMEISINGVPYGWGPFQQMWVKKTPEGDSPAKYKPVEVAALYNMGLVKGGDEWFGDMSTHLESFADFKNNIDNITPKAAWVIDLVSMQNAHVPYHQSYMVKTGNPLTLSLTGYANNPYGNLKDNQWLWNAFYQHAKSIAPEYIDSDGEDDSEGYPKIAAAFGLNYAYSGFNQTDQQAKVLEFLKDTVIPHMKKYAAPEVTTAPFKSNNPFPSIPPQWEGNEALEDAWNLFSAAAQGAELDFYKDQAPGSFGTYSFSSTVDQAIAKNPVGTENIPPSLYKFTQVMNQYGMSSSQFNTAMASVIQSGYWNPKEGIVKANFEVDGKKYSFDAAPGDTVYAASNPWGHDYFLVKADKKTIYAIGFNYTGSFSMTSGDYSSHFNFDAAGNPQNSSKTFKEIWNSPVDFDYTFAASKVPGVAKTNFDLFEDAALGGDKPWDSLSLPGFAGITPGDTLIHMKKVVTDNKDNADWATIAENWDAIPLTGKKLLHWAHTTNNEDIPKLVVLGLKYGQFSKKDVGGQPPINPNAVYYKKVMDGKISADDLNYIWNSGEVQQAAHDFLGISFSTFWDDSTYYMEKIADHLQGIIHGSMGLGSAEKKFKPEKMPDALTLHPASFKLGGMHSKGTWADEDGNKWISKSFSSDPNAKARIEAEHYAMKIGGLFGWNPPATMIMDTPDGKLSYVQHYADASGDMHHKGWKDISEGAMHSAMTQHIYDWIISNHDSHGGNLLLTVDGSDSYPIDRGQAFKFLGQDKLAVGYLPPGNPEAVWYDNVYDAIQWGQMSKEKADAVLDAVLRKAAIVQTRNDDEYRDLVTKALASRTQLPKKFSSTDQMVDFLMERKHNVFADFQKLWKGVYEQAGYEFPSKTIDDYLPKKLGEAHVSATPDFAADLQKSSSIGIPLFFAGTELDNGHIQFFTTKDKSGGTTLRAQAKLSKGADQILEGWLSKQTVKTGSTVSTPSVPAPPNHEELPGLADGHNRLVQFVTTVGSHIKKGDYEFNAATVNQAETYMTNLEDAIKKVQDHIDADPINVYGDYVMPNYTTSKFVTSEQQEAWLLEAEKMLENFKVVQKAMETKISVSKSHPSLVPFTMPTYSATTAIDTSGKPKITDQFKWGGFLWTRYSDENYIFQNEDGTGKPKKASKTAWQQAATAGTVVEVSKPEGEPAAADGESVIANAGTQIVKVTKQKAKVYSGTYDFTNDVVKETGETTTGINGNEYKIEFGDITIQYQARKDVSYESQQGVMRIQINSWQGDTAEIEKALSTLRSMGLELGEADETELELLYWRQLRATLAKRKKNTKWTQVQQALKDVSPSMNKAEELEAYRKAFGQGYGDAVVDKFISKKGFYPQMSKYLKGEVNNGRPYWFRPDTNIKDLKTATGGKLLHHSIPYGTSSDYGGTMVKIAKSGFLPTEERFRVLGKYIGGASSESDQGYGASDYLFFRQGLQPSEYSILLEPTAFYRTSNYSYDSDKFGNSSYKETSAPFDISEATAMKSHSGNETMVKNGVSIFDDIAVMVVPDASSRQEILEHLKSLGITEIRGIPIEERIVSGASEAKSTVDKVWKYWTDLESKGEVPWQ